MGTNGGASLMFASGIGVTVDSATANALWMIVLCEGDSTVSDKSLGVAARCWYSGNHLRLLFMSTIVDDGMSHGASVDSEGASCSPDFEIGCDSVIASSGKNAEVMFVAPGNTSAAVLHDK